MSPSNTHFIEAVDGVAPPAGYSMSASAARERLVFISGQVAFDAQGKVVEPGHFEAQVHQSFENLRKVLAASGCSPNDVVKCNHYVVGLTPERLGVVRSIRNAFFADPKPASTLVGVTALALPEFLYEIEVTACKP